MERHMTSTPESRHSRDSSSSPKNIINHRHANARMIEHIQMLWLDNNIDEENDYDCRCILAKLRSVVSTKPFTDGKSCVEFVNSLKNEKVCMMISGSLGQNMVPYVHSTSHVDSIYIFCRNKSLHEVWTKEWPKIKGIYISSIPICEALKVTVKKCDENSVAANYISSNQSEEIPPSFLLTQILKEIITNMNSDENDSQQLAKHSREIYANNEDDLKNIDVFEKTYSEQTPIWWYSHESFLYLMLQRGIRMIDINILTKMTFFIRDLHRQIEQVHKEQVREYGTNNNFTVYHGQGIPKSTFEEMEKTKSGFITFTGFFCASTDRRVSFNFAHRNVSNPELIGIFFVITIDPSKTKKPFAFINNVCQFEGKDEVLFPMNTVFYIRGIQSMGENNRLFQVDLTLLDDNTPDLRALNNRVQEETFPYAKGWNRFGEFLMKMEEMDRARELYNYLLKQTTDETARKHINSQLGKIKEYQILSQETIESSGISTENTLSTNHALFGKLRKSFKDFKKKLS